MCDPEKQTATADTNLTDLSIRPARSRGIPVFTPPFHDESVLFTIGNDNRNVPQAGVYLICQRSLG